ncbi:hypothetical protein C8Q74DRAFT_1454658 [Fomes fomentarius]|nr:hypothetical protein C8Q74DRAFT_1454658 [Fomes fomentarius]
MSPSPLSPNVVHLTHPIPPHLLSKNLLQRHHFLDITPEQPDEYLCWPSHPEKNIRVLEFLEARSRPIDDDRPTAYPVQYSFDGEDFFAHVDLSGDTGEGARLILQWDEPGEWKYHNSDLMPFPPGARPNLEDVLVPPPIPNPVSLHTFSYPCPFEANDFQDDSDDDDYWNAYGSTDIGDSHYGDGGPASAKDAGSSEDAYWAQYASVQGTADSTIPSPISQARRKPLPAVQQDNSNITESPVPLPVPVRVSSEDTNAEPLPIPPSIMPRLRSNSRWDPASPTVLAHLLSTLSPRESPAESPAPDGAFDMEDFLSSPTIGGSDDSDLSASPALGLQGTDVRAVPALTATSEPPSQNSSPGSFPNSAAGVPHALVGMGISDPGSDEDVDEVDLRAALEEAMDDDINNVTTVSDLAVWKRLLEDQIALFEKTFTRNAQLEAQVEELERELSVWKEAFKTADGDRKVLNKTVLKLERNIGALKEDNPLILCLIDGDGNIFSADLIKQGQGGGRQAAMLLTMGLTDYLASLDPAAAFSPSRGQIWLSIYCNKNGLLETLINNSICTMEEFEAFVLGFNQASPLFSIVDVGNGKEAADSKIKEYLRVFTRFPQTTKVFFGGAHDNGYTSTLNLLQNEGLLDKVVLLKGYKDLAHEINNLNLPQLEIEGVFIQKKLQTNGKQKVVAAAAAAASAAVTPATYSPKPPKQPPLQAQDNRSYFSKPGTPSNVAKPATPVRKPRPLDPLQPLHKQKPPPCNFFYLARCNNGDHCKYEHNYPLTQDQVAELRVNAKKWPCPAINNGNKCPLGEHCIMNHFCPKGAKCVFRKQGKCKFVGTAPFKAKKKSTKPKPMKSKKRRLSHDEPRASADDADEDESGSVEKRQKVEEDDGTVSGVRRSARNRGKKLDYKNDGDNVAATTRALPRVVSARARGGMNSAPRDVSIRTHNPKTYGAIPGIAVGTWWETRKACSDDAVHAPWVGGIAVGPEGAYSVALSGGYEDDVDLGEAFTYTGSGGRDLKGSKNNPKNLRSAPQSKDQDFDNNFNAALLKSSETKKPVRVIRGFKLDSSYAPSEGYRYDGLYTVEKRLPGQTPLAREEEDSEGDSDFEGSEA